MAQRAGRPPNTDIDSAAILYWFLSVIIRLKKSNAYYLEKLYKEKNGLLGPNDKYIYDKWFTQVEKGKNYPLKKYRPWFNANFPETERILNTPLWKIFNNPIMSQDKLFALLNDFPSDIAVHLLLNNRRTLKYLDSLSSIDALAACLWLMCELRSHFKSTDYGLYDRYLSMAFKILCQISADEAFDKSIDIVYLHFDNKFVKQSKSQYLRKKLNRNHFDNEVNYNKQILNVIDELSLLKKIKIAPYHCIPVSEKKLSKTFLQEINHAITTNERTTIKKHPKIKMLIRNLHRWENNFSYKINTVKEVYDAKNKLFGGLNVKTIHYPKLTKEQIENLPVNHRIVVKEKWNHGSSHASPIGQVNWNTQVHILHPTDQDSEND